MLTRVHHVGIVVPSLEEGYRFWVNTLGLKIGKTATIDDQGVKAALLPTEDGEIELLEPLNTDNSIGRFLSRRGGGLHHLCFETDDMEQELAAARRLGLPLIDAQPRRGLAGKICFLHPKACCGVLVEYAQVIE
jgi:methylmalonyl-CoA/ethylmalonyl-CoA epimerase